MERLAIRRAKKLATKEAARWAINISKEGSTRTYAAVLQADASTNVKGQSETLIPEVITATSNEGFTIQSEKEDSWTLVIRRRRSKLLKENTKVNVPFDLHHADLLSQGKCFKCLEKGHKRSQCKALRKCFKCQATDHIARRCIKHQGAPQKEGEPAQELKGIQRMRRQMPINSSSQFQSAHTFKPKFLDKQTPKQTTTMDPPMHWQNAQMLDPANFQIGRPEELRVFLPTIWVAHH